MQNFCVIKTILFKIYLFAKNNLKICLQDVITI